MATPDEVAVQNIIDQIWNTYDVNQDGALDKEEIINFVHDTLGNLGAGDEFTDEAYDEVFAGFDKDKNGKVDKHEVDIFIKQMLLD